MFDNFKTANYANALLSPELYARHLSRLFTGDVIDGFTVVPGTGLQTVLQPGNAFIRYGSAGVASAREVTLVSTFNLTHGTPDASNPRNDLVVLFVDNAVALPGGTPTSANLDGLGVAKAKVVAGTAAATPVDPSATAIQASVGAGNPYTILQRVRIDNGVSVIASNKITDVRSQSTPVIANASIPFAKTSGIWWEEIGRVTLGAAGDTLSVSSLPLRKYLRVVAVLKATGGNVNGLLRFNADTATNYAERISSNGGADTTGGSATGIGLYDVFSTGSGFFEADVTNEATKEKFVQSFFMHADVGAANVPTRRAGVSKWTNTASVISQISLANTGTGDYAIGSELIVLGHD